MANIPTIDSESNLRVRVPYDLDFFTERLMTENEIFVLPSPVMWVLKKNLFLLLKKSVRTQFKEKYKYKPDYLSDDEYGTVIIAPVLMYLNNIPCVEEFNMDYIYIPTKDAITDLCRDKYVFRDLTKLSKVNW